MSDEQLAQGKQWVTSRLEEVAADVELRVNLLSWRQSAEDFRSSRRGLVLALNDGTQHVEMFTDSELEDIPATPEVRREVEARLLKLALRLRQP